ncbi:MAG: M56 family metallopeptidase [bacterium]|nr:M56 family metallopeptidase [bacterium]
MSWLPLQAIADWLLTFAIHSTCILGLALLVSVLLRSRAIAWQERILRLSLWAAVASATAQMLFATTALPLTIAAPEVAPFLLGTLEGSVVADGAEPMPVAVVADAPSWSPAEWLALLAVGMSLGGGLWLLRAQLRLRAVLRRRTPETDGRTLAAAAAAAHDLGLRQSPHVSRSEEILTPIAFGFVRPEICLPRRAHSLADEELRAMLVHEIAHLRRRDPVWMWIGAGIHALFPWQVLLFLVRRRWSHLVELRCDAVAAEQTSPTAVARCLLDVAAWLKPAPVVPKLALGMAARPSALRQRVETALHRGAAGQPRPIWSMAVGGASLSALTFGAPGVSAEETEPFVGVDLPPAAVGQPVGQPHAGADSAFDANGSSTGAMLASALQLLDAEYSELERELAALRARAVTHSQRETVQPLIDEIAQRLTVVERSCAQVRALAARRANESSTPEAR